MRHHLLACLEFREVDFLGLNAAEIGELDVRVTSIFEQRSEASAAVACAPRFWLLLPA